MAAGPAAALFQPLEPRQMLTVISPTSFGAIPNDGQDDSAAIQRAVNASAPGDTIQFNAGTYNIGKAIDPKGEGRILKGNGATLQAGGGNFSFYFRGKDVTITGFTFKGRGIFMDKSGNQMVEGVVIDNNTFQLDVSGDHTNSVEFTTGLRNTRITNNTFGPIKGDNGIYGYYWDNLTIANNEFLGGNEGIHIIDHSNNSRNLLIEQNYFSGLHRMGIEYQGGGNNTIVQDNLYENPVLASESKGNADTFAYSIVADRSVSTIVRRNAAIMPTSSNSPDGIGVKIIFELGGKNLLAEDNYAVGGNHVVAVNGGGATGTVRNNRFVNNRQSPSNANGASAQFINNNPNVALSWDINRAKPGRNHRYGSTASASAAAATNAVVPAPPAFTPAPPAIVPAPAPTLPPPVIAPAPTIDVRIPSSLSARQVSASRVDLYWIDTSSSETGFKIERSSDGRTWTQIAATTRNMNRYSDFNVPLSGNCSYRVRAYSAVGNSGYSNVATAVAPPSSITATTAARSSSASDPAPTSESLPTPPPNLKAPASILQYLPGA